MMTYTPGLGIGMGATGVLLIIVVIWSFFWKGLGLWHSAQRSHRWWFIIMLIVNTLGILEIIYLFGIAKLTFSTLFTSRVPPDNKDRT